MIKGSENFDRFRHRGMDQRAATTYLNVIRNVAEANFENCLPDTSGFFVGLWRRPHKAMSFADHIRRIAQQRLLINGSPPTVVPADQHGSPRDEARRIAANIAKLLCKE